MTRPVVIVGAGPAGLACADEISRAGRRLIIIDDNLQAGGQYFRQLPAGYRASPGNRLLREKARFDQLAQVLGRTGVTHLAATVVWGAPAPLTIAYAGIRGSGRIEASAIVVATGAQDRPLPFTGWTLPGVISAGGCLNLAKAHGLVPEGRVLVAGNGPLVLVAAATMIAAGANVIGVVEACPSRRLLPAIAAGVTAAPKILRAAADYRWRILRSGAWFLSGWMIAEASGDGSVRRAAIAPVGEDGRPIRSREVWHDVDTLVVGYGLLPSVECVRLMGCDTKVVPGLNGMVPIRSETLETSVAGVYAVGDGAGIGGVEVALLEGRIAAHAILGATPAPGLLRSHASLDRFRRTLNLKYRLQPPLRAAGPATLICRCEELSLRDLMADPASRSGHIDRLKRSSRIGMGRCQGRNCLPALAELLGLTVDAHDSYPRSRPPLRPVQLRHLAADADSGPANEPDEALVTVDTQAQASEAHQVTAAGSSHRTSIAEDGD